MSLANQNSFNVFDGDAATTVFNWTFALPVGSTGTEIVVYIIDDEGVITQLASNYSQDLNTNQLTYPVQSGVAPLDPGVTALPVGWQIAIYRTEPITQGLSLTTQGPFPAASIMGALDYLTMICQQLQEQLNRCVKYPIGQVPTTTDVNDFIAAVNAIIMTPPIQGTYAYVKAIAALDPTTPRFAIASDLGVAGEFSLLWYSGLTTVGDTGWFAVGG